MNQENKGSNADLLNRREILKGLATIPVLGLSPNIWWVIGITSGICTAGIWSTDRPLLTYITIENGGKSEGDIGKFFGLMSVTGRLSTVVGPFVWGLLVITFGWGQTIGVAFLLISTIIALFCLYGVKIELSSTKNKR